MAVSLNHGDEIEIWIDDANPLIYALLVFGGGRKTHRTLRRKAPTLPKFKAAVCRRCQQRAGSLKAGAAKVPPEEKLA